jgi:hypothetical protein
MRDEFNPLAAPADSGIQVLPTSVNIHQLTIDRPKVVAYLQNIPSDKLAIALMHALEVGITELAARRQRFEHPTGSP